MDALLKLDFSIWQLGIWGEAIVCRKIVELGIVDNVQFVPGATGKKSCRELDK